MRALFIASTGRGGHVFIAVSKIDLEAAGIGSGLLGKQVNLPPPPMPLSGNAFTRPHTHDMYDAFEDTQSNLPLNRRKKGAN